MIELLADVLSDSVVIVPLNGMNPEYLWAIEGHIDLLEGKRGSVFDVVITARIGCDPIAKEAHQCGKDYLFSSPDSGLPHNRLQLAIPFEKTNQILTRISCENR
jgi:hypothetical protein